MAHSNEPEKDHMRTELTKLADITTVCEEIYEKVLVSLKSGEILPLAAQPLLQQHLETVNNVSVIKMVENRLKQIQRREVSVLVVGEFNAGKSTFVNILMGGPYLPMDRGKVTHVVCEIRHCSLRMAILKFDDHADDESIMLQEDSSDETWQELRRCIREKTFKCKETEIIRSVERIVIYWPLKVIEDISADIGNFQENFGRLPQHSDMIGRLPQHGDMIRQEQNGGDRSWNLPNEFLSRLQRPHAESFIADEHADRRDPDQTYRKEVVTSGIGANSRTPQTQPIEISRPVDSDTYLKTPASASVERASDLAPASQPSEGLAGMRREHSENLGEHDDQCLTVDNDTCPSDSTGIVEDRTELNQTEGEHIAGRPSISQREETNSKQVSEFQFVILDCPGIDLQDDEKDSPEYTGMVGEVERCQAFLFISNTTNDTGVKKRGIKALMQDIESDFKRRNVNMNPDQSLFVANRADDVLEDPDKTAKLRREVAQKLAETWPLTREDHVFPFNAKKGLKEIEHSNTGQRMVQRFLLRAMRLTVEEHCIWLLKMLEIAHAMAKLGQKSFPVVQRLKVVFDRAKQDAMALQDEVNEINDTEVCFQARVDLKDLLLRHEADFQHITWDCNEIKKRIPNEEIDWPDLLESIQSLIGEKVEKTVEFAALKLKEKYKRAFENVYKKVDEKMKSLQSGINGLEEIKREEYGLKSGVFSLFAPAVLSVSVRAAPVFYPFVFLAAPIITVGLFGHEVIEDIRESRRESKRSDFKNHKAEFMRKETERVLKIAKMDVKGKDDLPDSPLYKYFFGESKKKVIHDKTEKVLQVVDILQGMAYNIKESSQMSCKMLITEMMKFYVEKVMKHEFTEKDDIIWDYNEEGIRRTIELGSNACTYEAKISERFGFKGRVAVKEFRCKLEPSEMSTSLPPDVDAYRECFYLRQLSSKHHEKLVNFLGTGASVTDGYLNLRIVMERYLGNLKKLVIASPRLSAHEQHRQEFLHYAKECTEGLKFLHDNNIIHRDIKPSNYLIKEDTHRATGNTVYYSVVISDVGCAKAEEANCTLGQELGTRVYWAPEISLANTFHSKCSDMFSLGLVLWEVWVRKLSFDQNGRRRELLKVVEAENIPLIKSCLMTDPRKRITSANLLKELMATAT